MAFMIPMAIHFSQSDIESMGYDTDEYNATRDHDEGESGVGWYGYLSAPGYLDRTDYSGPFDTADEALQYVMDLYEVDENGNSLDPVIDGIDRYGSVD